MKVSFIIPFASTLSSLDKVLTNIHSLDDVEVIIVDDRLTKMPRISVSNKCIIIENEKNLGAAASRNIGARKASGEYFIFLDSDVYLDKLAIRKIFDHIEDDKEIFEGVNKDISYQGFFSNFYNLRIRYGFLNEKEYSNNCITSLFAIKKKVFSEVGGFDESVKGASVEDILYGYQLEDYEYKIFLDKTLELEHLKEFTFLSLLRNDLYRSYLWTRVALNQFRLKAITSSEGFDHAGRGLIWSMLISPLYIFSFYSLSIVPIIMIVQFLCLKDYLKFFFNARGTYFSFFSFLFYILENILIFIACSFSGLVWLNSKIFIELDERVLKKDLSIKFKLPVLFNAYILPLFYNQITKVNDFLKSLNDIKVEEENIQTELKSEYNVAIIGGGPGGLTVYDELSHHKSIVVLNDGKRFRNTNHFSFDTYTKVYRKSGLDYTISSKPLISLEGRCWGGASQVNTGIASFSDPEDQDQKKISAKFTVKNLNSCAVFDNLLKNTSLPIFEDKRFRNELLNGNVFDHILNNSNDLHTTRVKYITKLKDKWALKTYSKEMIFSKNIVLSCGALQTMNLLSRSGLINGPYELYTHPIVRVALKINSCIHNELSTKHIFLNGFKISMGHSSPDALKVYSKLSDTNLQNTLIITLTYIKMPSFRVYYSEIVDENFILSNIPDCFYNDLSTTLLQLQEKLLIGENKMNILCEGISLPIDRNLNKMVLANSKPLISILHLMGSMYSISKDNDLISRFEDEGIFISDASTLKGVIGTNPQLTIMANSLKIARKIEKRLYVER